ncbi:MAG: hypothetical protein K9L86_05290 [Candidatus Omnitrophica bacterium]|nr:hypothetical protein [Candidatus Omnitrophota bacterium]
MIKKKITKKNQGQKSIFPVGVMFDKDSVGLLFKSTDLGKPELYLAKGKTGRRFTQAKTKVEIAAAFGQKAKIESYQYLAVSLSDKGYFMTFLQKGKTTDCLIGATSKDLKRFKISGKISKVQERGVLVSNYKLNGKYGIYFGQGSIKTAFSSDLKKWKISDVACLAPRSSCFDQAPLSVLAAALTPSGLLVIYDSSYKQNGRQTLQIGGALFSLSDPNNLIWRSEVPLWDDLRDIGSQELNPLGAVFHKEEILVYFVSKTGEISILTIHQPFPSVRAKKVFANLKRFHNNPIIVPNTANDWEAEATFNPAALYDDGKVHILYRAVSKGGLSSFGYAASKDGFSIEPDSIDLSYVPREDFEGVHTKPAQRIDLYKSGCGWGGCEDPKLTAIDNKVYLTYVAYNGYSHPRIALSTIEREDFLNQQWNWEKPKLISPPGVVDKSGCILPEKVKGKYVIFHRIFPHILIDYRDDLKFDDGSWLETKGKITTRPGMWDSRKLSVGATPIKTSQGWLVIYHAVDDRDDTRYKIGAMILDLKDPSKVLFRTSNPILEPDEHYENEGKPGVVYPCGAVVLGDELFVYYGGGDRVVCCATAQLDQLIKSVKKDKAVSYQLRKVVYS